MAARGRRCAAHSKRKNKLSFSVIWNGVLKWYSIEYIYNKSNEKKDKKTINNHFLKRVINRPRGEIGMICVFKKRGQVLNCCKTPLFRVLDSTGAVAAAVVDGNQQYKGSSRPSDFGVQSAAVSRLVRTCIVLFAFSFFSLFFSRFQEEK